MSTKNNIQHREIAITTNIACNLRCIYCYEKDKNSTTTFDIDKAKATLQKILSQKTENGTIISFHGGEPFLSYLKIRELCEWAWQQKFEDKFIFHATSNGTLIHGEIQDWLYKNKERFCVCLSIDGNKKMHDTNRSQSFDLIDLQFFIKTWPYQDIKMTISPKSIDYLADGIIYLHEQGVENISANLAEMMDWSDSKYLDVYERELTKLSNYYLANPKYRGNECSLFAIYFAAALNDELIKWCGTGTNMQSFDIDGRKYPCHLFFESVCGKKLSDIEQELDFTNINKLVSPTCKGCKFLQICPTCYGSNFIARGNIANRDMSVCELNKIRFKVVAQYQCTTILNDESVIDDEKKYARMKTLEGIKKIFG